MNLDIYVRDGGVQAAQARGVDKLIYYVTMPRLPDEEVLSYFMGKKVALLEALENNEVPPMCSEEDRWGGIRCERYCDVARHCAGYCLKGAIDILIDAGHGGISLGDDEL
jgi:N-acetylmuramoyl-L-alanine amidase